MTLTFSLAQTDPAELEKAWELLGMSDIELCSGEQAVVLDSELAQFFRVLLDKLRREERVSISVDDGPPTDARAYNSSSSRMR